MGTIPEVWVASVVSVSNKYGTKPAVLGELEGAGVEELDGISVGEDGASVEELDGGSIVGEDGAGVVEIGGSSVGEEGAGVEDDREVSVIDGGGVPQMQVHDCSG